MVVRIYELAYIDPMNIEPVVFFRALADATRLRCLVLLQREGELCVCELTHALGLVQPKISRHLAQLREAQIVLDRREGLWVHYRLHPDLPAWARTALEAASTGAAGQPLFVQDRAALADMPNRPGARCCA
jgi:ArsR family transcriptional regulator, arsenate/arsenite/antimonite-responsive transcriptional repressor